MAFDGCIKQQHLPQHPVHENNVLKIKQDFVLKKKRQNKAYAVNISLIAYRKISLQFFVLLL